MADYSDEHLTARLRLLLKDEKISIREAAERIDVPYRTLQNQLAGKNRMPASTFAKLTEMLDVPARFVAEGTIKLDRYALTESLKQVLGDLLPTVDKEFVFHLPKQPDDRTKQQRDHDAEMLAFVVRDAFEWHHVRFRFPSYEVD